MFYLKPNFKYASPLAGNDDLQLLKVEGLTTIAQKANNGDRNAQAIIQRLVNSQIISEGNY